MIDWSTDELAKTLSIPKKNVRLISPFVGGGFGSKLFLRADDMTDIGTGSYTIIAQTTAEMMGLPLDKVVVRLGESTFPVSSGSGGQFGANNSTAGVYAACVKLREAVAQRLGFNSADAVFADGLARFGNRSVSLADAAREEDLVAEDGIEYGDLDKTYQQSTFGAHFGCSRSAPRAAFSIPSRRVARCSVP
jgi:xanthine dehydrogenase YagR molybdenum-binding subunit